MISLRTSSSSLLAVLAASSLLVACDADPIGGGSGGGGGDDTTVVSTSTGTDTGVGGSDAGSGGGQATTTSSTGGGNSTGGGPAASESIALYGDEIPDVGSGGSSSSGTGGSDPGYDDHLYLFVSRGEVLCADPFAVDEACPEVAFKAIIGLPPEYQQSGIYDLDDPAIISSYSEWGPNGDGSCYGGGGSFFDGTIEVVSIEADRVRLILDGTSPAGLDGQHAAFFCGDDPPPPEESSVIGYYPSDLPPPESGSSAVTSGGSEEKFILVFADHAQSCADPFGNQPGPGETHNEVVIRLPQAYLAPGTYDLADPMIEADSFFYEESSAASGGGGVPGTLTIHEVTATTVDLELSGTQYDFANVAAVVPRCGG